MACGDRGVVLRLACVYPLADLSDVLVPRALNVVTPRLRVLGRRLAARAQLVRGLLACPPGLLDVSGSDRSGRPPPGSRPRPDSPRPFWLTRAIRPGRGGGGAFCSGSRSTPRPGSEFCPNGTDRCRRSRRFSCTNGRSRRTVPWSRG